MIEAPTIDKLLGMDYYVYEGLNLGDVLEFRKSPNTFRVFEVSLDGVKASFNICFEGDVAEKLTSKYVHYVLCKEGVDTFYAIQLLKKFFKADIGYAGLKDSDSYSCQFISLNTNNLRNSDGLIRASYSLGPLRLCFYRSSHYPVRSGYLLGNLFNVFLNFIAPQNVVMERLRGVEDLLKSMMLPNYYGYQRFGTIRPITHLVGKAIVRRAWDEATRLIAGAPHVLESESVIRAREEFESGNFRKAYKLFSSDYWIERIVCRAMMMYGDPLKAINSLPIEILNFYVEAYQSYLFNKALSKALRHLGGVESVSNTCETLIVPGTNMALRDGICESFVREVMNAEGVEQQHFLVRDLNINCRSYVRESTFKVKDLNLNFVTDGVWMEFMLIRGCYASILLRELFKGTAY
ncbi:MAG: tRNA pseudouridine(13) synthase TruD [Sulfolobales archaeon]|nr:tRNA pseudouridine(13) synthase TruD [Sulfolobales archaeon]MCX8185662.1 tRNA pseudouridine(13) synthase TruD [Sulfolobales archaeon]MDW7969605.1 tRNA pseudouridine(13) synthase TruD [Sulfolobales archaeon]